MRKLFVFIFGLLFLIQGLLYPIRTYATADRCQNISATFPSGQNVVNLDIDVSNVVATNTTQSYTVWVNGQELSGIDPVTGSSFPLFFKPSNGHINPTDIGPYPDKTFQSKTYPVSVGDQNNPLCVGVFSGQQTLAQGQCTIDFINKPEELTPKNDVIIKIGNLSGNQSDIRNIIIKKFNDSGQEVKSFRNDIASLQNPTNLGKFDSSSYYLKVEDDGILGNRRKLCDMEFTIGVEGGGFGTPYPSSSPPPLSCTEGLSDINNPNSITTDPKSIVKCTKVATAFGINLSTDPTQFVKAIFGIVLSLAGGLAIVLIMISGYRLMFSGGNPEKAQAARDQLTSAIVGLLFIIFSMTILQVIGVDILHIPGLTR